MKINTGVLLGGLFLIVLPSIIHFYPPLMGAEKSYMVLSGSMNPTLRLGDLVIVKESDPTSIDLGDLISIKKGKMVFTHRVVGKRKEDGIYHFKTKGDANEEPDTGWIVSSQIIGKVVIIIPLGYLHSPLGYTLSFLIPCFMLVGNQTRYLLLQFKRRSKRELRRWRRNKPSALDTSSMLLLTILVVNGSWLMAPYFQVGSFSYFFDQEWTSVSFTAGQWETPVRVDIHPDTLNLKTHGRWITAYVNLSSLDGYDAYDVEEATLYLEEIPIEWGEIQGTEIFMAKFKRTTVIDYLIDAGYGDGESVTLTVGGEFMDGSSFQGNDVINLVQDGE
ncbi:MAG: signal peptidase I [Thermoproteota archaeon]